MHTHLGREHRVSRAILDAMAEVMVPKFLAMLCVIAVFIPSFFMVGIGRALFPPLALAVAFSMMASFILSVTLVPVLAAYLFRGGKHGAPHAQGGRFERLQERYSGFAKWLVGRRRLVLAVYCLVCIPAFLLARHIGTELSVTVMRVLQTVGGRMIFGHPKGEITETRRPRAIDR